MDIYCPKCGEPVEIDYFHDIAERDDTSFDYVRRDFQARGCEAIDTTCNPQVNRAAAEMAQVLYELYGDDIDAVANELDDAEYFGMLG